MQAEIVMIIGDIRQSPAAVSGKMIGHLVNPGQPALQCHGIRRQISIDVHQGFDPGSDRPSVYTGIRVLHDIVSSGVNKRAFKHFFIKIDIMLGGDRMVKSGLAVGHDPGYGLFSRLQG